MGPPRKVADPFSPGSWGQPIARVMGPPGAWPADPRRDDRKPKQGSFRRRSGTPSGGTYELSGVIHDRNKEVLRRWTAGQAVRAVARESRAGNWVDRKTVDR